MGIWQRIKDRLRKGKQEEKPEETPDPELEERRKRIVVYGIDLGKAGGDITVTSAEENVQADPKMYGDQKEMLNNWRKMHGKPMRRRWSNIVR